MVETDVLSAALKLSPAKRARIAQELILSLENEPFEDPRVVEQAWAEEVQRRIDDLETGKVKGIPAEKVFADARTKVRARGRR